MVLNLPRDFNESSLVELFKTYGNVGFGFVEMEKEDEATDAITALHQSKLGKNKIRVKLAN